MRELGEEIERDLKKRSRRFAHNCVKLAILLKRGVLEDHVKKQLVRASTSVAANLGQTKRSFISQLSIVVEESDECVFWLEFLEEEKILIPGSYEEILKEARELTAIFRQDKQLNFSLGS